MEVYMDNGATTRTDPEVVEAMVPLFFKDYGNASSLHDSGSKAKKCLDEARKIIASAIGAEPDEIIFTSGGTESDNLAILGAAMANKDKGNHIITSKIEHPAVLNTCRFLEKNGFTVDYLDVDVEGIVDPRQLESMISEKTILVSVMHANNEIGTIQPIDKIGGMCKAKGILFHTDAVQSLTKIPIDAKSMDIDLASFSGHKVHGPKGVGALYVKKGTKLVSMFHGGGHEYRKRPGTENIPGIYGFAKAVEMNNLIHARKISILRDRLIAGLLKIPDARLNGSRQDRLCNNVNVSFSYVEGESMLTLLDMDGIAVSTGSACSSKSLEPSHVLLAIGLERKDSHGTIRFTLSKYNTAEEVDYVIERTAAAVERLRMMSPLNAKTIHEYEIR